MFVKIDDCKWIQSTAVEFFYVKQSDTEKFNAVFGLHNGHALRSKDFKTPKEAENFARTLTSMRNQED